MTPVPEIRRKLRVPWRAPQIHDHVFRDVHGHRFTALLRDQIQREVDPGRNARSGCDAAIDYEHAVAHDRHARRTRPQRIQQIVMRGAAASIQQSRARRQQRARADSQQTMRGVGGLQLRPQYPAQPVRDCDDLRRRPEHMDRRLSDEHDPRRRSERCRQRLQLRNRQPDRSRDRCRWTGEPQAKLRSLAKLGVPRIDQAEGLGRPGNVEQQRMRGDHEEDIDGRFLVVHLHTLRTFRSIGHAAVRANAGRGRLSVFDPFLSIRD